MTRSARDAVCGFGRQTGEGAPLAVPKFEIPMGGGGINPVRNTAELPWTDESRDAIGHYVSLIRGDFGMDVPVLPISFVALLQAALGNLVTTGTGPYDHEVTPADVLPWMTFFFGVGDEYLTLADAKIGTLVVRGAAGGPLSGRVEGMGKALTRTQPATKWGAPGIDEPVNPFLQFIKAVIKLEDTATPAATVVHNLRNFELRIENNLEAIQTDDIGYQFVGEGRRVIRISSTDVVLEDFDFIKTTHFGSPTATELAESTIYGSMNLLFKGSDGADITVRALEFDLPRLHWEGAEWPSADPGGAPITYGLAGAASKPAAGAILTASMRNGSAGTVY
jgi:hypothetical protein